MRRAEDELEERRIEYGARDLFFVCAGSILVDNTLQVCLAVEAQPLHGRLRQVKGASMCPNYYER